MQVASIHTSSVSKYVAETEGHQLTEEVDDNAEDERINSNRDAYSDEDIARLKKMLDAGMTFGEVQKHFPGRSYGSLKKRGIGWTKFYWSKHDHELLSKGLKENLNDQEIKNKYLPARTTAAITVKRYKFVRDGVSRRPDAWSEGEIQTLSRLREEGKTVAQIQQTALSYRSEEAIQSRIIKLVAEQKLLRRAPTYGYTDADIQNLKSLHAQGLDNAQIASRFRRAVKSILSKMIRLGLRSNPTPKRIYKPPWTKAEDEHLRPFLHNRLEYTKLRELLPDRTETAIRSRISGLRKRDGIVLNAPYGPWTPEAVQQLHSFFEERKANNGSPTWSEIAERIGRGEGALKTKVFEIRNEQKRAKLAQDPKQSEEE